MNNTLPSATAPAVPAGRNGQQAVTTRGETAAAAAVGTPAQGGSTARASRVAVLRDLSLFVALGLLFAFFFTAEHYFLSPRNLTQLAIELSITAVLALGMLLIILTGNIDLSAGSGVGLIGGIASVLVTEHAFGAPAALLVALLAAVVLWTAMGALIVYQKIPAFIITLGGLLVFKGVFWLVIHSQTIPVVAGGEENLYSLLTTYYLPPQVGYLFGALIVVGAFALRFFNVAERRRYNLPTEDNQKAYVKLAVLTVLVAAVVVIANRFRGVPLPVVILTVVALAVHFVTTSTPFGRYLYAIGGNEDASRLSGVPVERVVVSAFGIMGILVAITGFMQTAYAGASTTTVGDLMELDAVAACVIGGTSLKGGRGTVLGVIMGALIMATLINGMTLMAVSPELKFIVRGGVLAAAVWLDVALTRRNGR